MRRRHSFCIHHRQSVLIVTENALEIRDLLRVPDADSEVNWAVWRVAW